MKNFCVLGKDGAVYFVEKDLFSYRTFTLQDDIGFSVDAPAKLQSIDDFFNNEISVDTGAFVLGVNLNTTINDLIKFYKKENLCPASTK